MAIVNNLEKARIPTFGPYAEVAALEGSKSFMKHLCEKYGIPTAKYKTFTNPSAAKLYIKEQCTNCYQSSGLSAGKGVTLVVTMV
ncbi:hypothetical protein K1719_014897 [Acacia pycnantha]|nr:hypothetical protein K1719_014897 [Acacia pycnantha]